VNSAHPICGPDLGRNTDERNAAFCLCGSADPYHRWFPHEANPDLQQYRLSDGIRDLLWDHGQVQERHLEAVPEGAASGAANLRARTFFANAGRVRAVSILLLLLATGAFLFITTLNAHARNPEEAGRTFGGFIVGVVIVAVCAALAMRRWKGHPEGATLLMFSSIMALGLGGLAIVGLKVRGENRTFTQQLNEIAQLNKDMQVFATGGPPPPKRSTDPDIEGTRALLTDIARRQLEARRADQALGMEELLDHPERAGSAAQLTRELELTKQQSEIWAKCYLDVERIVSSKTSSQEGTFLTVARKIAEKQGKARRLHAVVFEADVALLAFLRDTFGAYSYRDGLYDSSSAEWRSRFGMLLENQRVAAATYNKDIGGNHAPPLRPAVLKAVITEKDLPQEKPFGPFIEYRVTPDVTSVHLGETVTLHFELITQADLRGLKYVEFPRFEGFSSRKLEAPSRPEPRKDVVDGRTVIRYTLLKMELRTRVTIT
jgi:hypothetical protein